MIHSDQHVEPHVRQRDHTQPPEPPETACPLPGHPVPLHHNGPHIDQAALWHDLRQRFGVVAPVEVSPDVQAWLLLGYHESLQVLRDTHYFSTDPRRWRAVRDGQVSLSEPTPLRDHALAVPGDHEQHRRLRSPLAASLGRLPEGVLFTETSVLAHTLIDAFVAEGSADLVGQYARLLPLMLLTRRLGLDTDSATLLCDLLVRGPEVMEPSEVARRVGDFCRVLVEHRRVQPGNDIPSWLIQHPSRLTDDEVVAELRLLLHASDDPTTHLIGNTLRRLFVEPRLMAAFTGGSVSPTDVIDYVMWVDPPLPVLPARYAVCDMRVGSSWIREGDALLVGLASAHNDLGTGDGGAISARGNRAHLMWGAGAHTCPAQRFAQDVVSIAVTSILDRLVDLHAVAVPRPEIRWRDTVFVHGVTELPVRFVPGAPHGLARDPVPGHNDPRSRRLARIPTRNRAKGARYHNTTAAQTETAPEPETLAVVTDDTDRKPRKQRERTRPAGARYHVPD